MDTSVLVIAIVVAAVLVIAFVRFGRDRSRRIGYSANEPARRHWREEHADPHHGDGKPAADGEGGPWGTSRAAEEMPQSRPGGPGPLPEAGLAEVGHLLGRGRKIEAIKLVRERTGLGLKDAKELVERLESGGETGEIQAGTRAGLPDADLGEVRRALGQGRKIEAIKLVRERTGMGLKEAKDFVESLDRRGRR